MMMSNMIMPVLWISSMNIVKKLSTMSDMESWQRLFIGTGLVLLSWSKYIRTVQKITKKKQRVQLRK